MRCPVWLSALVAILGISHAAPYYGTKIGKFKTYHHDVVGEVYAVDDKHIFIKGFTYDGAGPDAFFWAGSTSRPDATGFIIPDENGASMPLKAYRNKDILLKLPGKKTLRDIRWLAVWCRKFQANFGDLIIPRNLQIPRATDIGKLSSLQHGVSSGNVMVLDSRTFLVPDFTYDGQGPAAYWWVSKGSRQNSAGERLKDENGSGAPLKQYSGKTVVITLPEGKSIYDYDWLGVWCEEFSADFGNVRLPRNILVPPALTSLGIKPENKFNCEVLHNDLGFEIRWVVDSDDVVMQLVGKIGTGEYMAFGWSKDDAKTKMVGADAVVTFLDKYLKGHAVDYYLESKQQCVGSRGSCPDAKSGGTEDVTFLNSAVVNGYTMITFKRSQIGKNTEQDQHIYSDGPQAIMWAIGSLNQRNEVSYHGKLRTEGQFSIDFFRPPTWNCPDPADESSNQRVDTTPRTTVKPKPQARAWDIPPIVCPADRTFRVQIGPTGGKRGYQAITGNVGWGIAWYVNGLLVPEITVQRGKMYTFLVEGGHDSQNPSRHHPLYITDDKEGGYEYKSPANREKVTIFAGAGIDPSGKVVPTASGRLCEWHIPKNRSVKPDDYATFQQFRSELDLKCEPGRAGVMKWKPDRNTPDLVYYQCFTHRFLGWKIHVVDSCGEDPIHEPVASGSGRTNKTITYDTQRIKPKSTTTTQSPVDYEIIYYDYVEDTNRTTIDVDYDIARETTTQKPVTTPPPRRTASTRTWNSAGHLNNHRTSRRPEKTRTSERPSSRPVQRVHHHRTTVKATIRPNSKPLQNLYQGGFVPLIIRTNSTLEQLFDPDEQPTSRQDKPKLKFGDRIRKPGSVPLLIPNAPNIRRQGSNGHPVLMPSIVASDVRAATLIPDRKNSKPSRGPYVPMLVPVRSGQEEAKNGGRSQENREKPRPLIPLVVRTHPNGTNYSILDHVLSLIAEDRSHLTVDSTWPNTKYRRTN